MQLIGDCGHTVSTKQTKTCKTCYRRKLSEKFSLRGEKHFNWKGGISINKWGYLRYNPTHKYGGKFVHVIVMEQKLGRKINSKIEKVHHINENKLDNRPENLILLSILEHNKLHKTGGNHWKNRKRINGRFA